MINTDVVVVGAGHNALTLGAYLAKAGVQVLILERRLEIGGGLCTEEVTVSGFRHNLHSIYHMMPDIMPPYVDLELAEYGVSYVKPPVQMAMPFSDGKCLILYNDVEKTCKSISKVSGKDAEAYRKLHEKYDVYMREIIIPATYAPPVPPLDLMVMLQKTDLGREFLEFAESSSWEIISENFEDDRVKTLLLYLTCMWGLRHDEGGLGYLVPLYFNRSTNYALCVGGSHRLSSALAKIVCSNGGQILENEEVVKINVKDDAAVGVELAGGTQISARVVVSSVDPPQTFLKLIEEKHLDSDFIAAIKNWKWEEWSLFNGHFALHEAPNYTAAADNPAINEALICLLGYEGLDDLLAHWKAIEAGKLTEVPAGHCTCPTLFDSTQAPSGKHTGFYSQFAPYELKEGGAEAWDRIRDRHLNSCLDVWSRYAPNMTEKNVMGKYPYTPLDIERKLIDMVRGSIKQGSYTPLQMGYFRPNDRCSNYRTPIKNLYLCGSCCYPGGMITAGAGYNAVNALVEDLGIKKWWKTPDYILQARAKGLL